MKPQSAIAIKDSQEPQSSHSALPALPLAQLDTQATLRSGLLSEYRKLREGKITTQAFQEKMPSPSSMSQWRKLGTDEQVMTIVAMIYEIWPARRDASELTPLIWLRNLRNQPLLSIYEAFVRLTEQPNKWRPDPGTFAQEVRRHARATETAIFNTTEKGPGV